MAAQIPFYLLDDEIPLVDTLSRLVLKVYPDAKIVKAHDGLDGLEMIEQGKIPSVIISDVYMPGLNGFQILKKIRQHPIHKKSYIIIITSKVDKEMNLKAVQLGADDFMTKPFSIDQLFVKLRGATRAILAAKKEEELNLKIEKLSEVIKHNRDQVDGLIRLFQDARMGELNKRIPSILDSASWIARRLTDDDDAVDDLIRATQMIYAGKLLLNDSYIVKPIMTGGEIRSSILEKYPLYVDQIFGSLDGAQEVQRILRHIYENYDGTGIPDKLQAWEIPLASRILRVCLDYEDYYEKSQGKQQKAVESLYKSWNVLYDHRIVAYYDQFLAMKVASSGKLAPEKSATVKELHERMIIARHIITESGLKLMSAGTVLTEEKIDKIKQIISTDPLIGQIYVKN